jgi:hypothetical protein
VCFAHLIVFVVVVAAVPAFADEIVTASVDTRFPCSNLPPNPDGTPFTGGSSMGIGNASYSVGSCVGGANASTINSVNRVGGVEHL